MQTWTSGFLHGAITTLLVLVALVACGAIQSECGLPSAPEPKQDERDRSPPVDRCNQPIATTSSSEEISLSNRVEEEEPTP